MASVKEIKNNKKYGYLTIIRDPYKPNLTDKHYFVDAICICGKIVTKDICKLKIGRMSSCRCKLNERLSECATKHGGKGTRLFKTWSGMRGRCNSIKNKDYNNYGGRGIKICKEWDDFAKFRDWAQNNGYSDNLTIERKDVNGDYCSENCKWITLSEQSYNKRVSRKYTYNNINKTLPEWSKDKICKVGFNTLKNRIENLKWNFEKALLSEKK